MITSYRFNPGTAFVRLGVLANYPGTSTNSTAYSAYTFSEQPDLDWRITKDSTLAWTIKDTTTSNLMHLDTTNDYLVLDRLNLKIGSDSNYIYLGGGEDARLNYNGTDLIINPRVVGTGHVRIPSGSLYVETGNVGIGVTSAQSKLEVSTSALGSVPAAGSDGSHLMVTADGRFGTMVGPLGSGASYIQSQRFDGTATTYPLLLNPNGGNIGIGNSTATYELDIGGTTDTSANVLRIISGANYDTSIRLMELSDSYGFSIQNDASENTLNIVVHENDATGTSAISVLRASRNVGIGTTTPAQRLDVNGITLLRDALYFTQEDGAEKIDSDADGDLDYYAGTSHDFLIGTTEQLSLTDGVLAPTTDSDVDLGTSLLYFKDAYIDSITMTGVISAGVSDLYANHAIYSDSTTQAITSTTVPWAMHFDTTEIESGVTLGRTSTVTISNASPAVVSWVAHGLYVDSPVVFTTTDTLPVGLTAGTTYYVISAGFGADSFQVSATPQGAAINTSSDGAGTHTATNTSIMEVSVAGDWGFIFSSLCSSSSAGTTFDIWFRKNGTNVDRSNTRTEVANSNNVIVSVADVVMTLTANDKIEMFWVSSSTNGQLLAIAAQANPTRPATPSTILTIKKISK